MPQPDTTKVDVKVKRTGNNGFLADWKVTAAGFGRLHAHVTYRDIDEKVYETLCDHWERYAADIDGKELSPDDVRQFMADSFGRAEELTEELIVKGSQ